MTKTILNQTQRAVVNKVIASACTEEFKDINTWKQCTPDEKNLLQAIFYAVRTGDDTGEVVDYDLDEDIKNLFIGKDNYWGVEHLQTDYVIDKLKRGLDVFK